MKKLLTSVVLLCAIFTTAAQECMTFDGIEMNNMSDFTESLKKSGWRFVIKHDNITFSGEYADELCILVVVPNSEDVTKVGVVTVMFYEQSTWEQTKRQYYKIADSLTVAYGNPTAQINSSITADDVNENSYIHYELDYGRALLGIMYQAEIGRRVGFTLINASAESGETMHHLEFMGIPIDGNVDDFVAKLKAKGFTDDPSVTGEEGIAAMKGLFTGEKVSLYAVYTPKTKTVWKIGVYFDMCSSWSLLKQSYLTYKRLFTEKYGSMCLEEEEFRLPYEDGGGSELSAIKDGYGKYKTIFATNDGYISIEICSIIYNQGQILITYQDKQNSDLLSAEQMSDL